MRLLRELSLYWVPVIASLAALLVFTVLALRFSKEFYDQYGDKVKERDDAINRVKYICRNITLVHETNYGSECRKFQRISESMPLWEALTGTADSYYGICDARRGCGIGATILLMAMAGMTAALFVVFKLSYSYRDRVRGWNAEFEGDFMLENPPGVWQPHRHDHRHRAIRNGIGAHVD